MDARSYQYKVLAIDSILSKMKETFPATHTYAQSMMGIANTLRNGVDALGRMQASPNPTITKALHEKTVATAASKLTAQGKAAHEKFHSIVRDGLRDIEARIATKIKLVPNDYAKEIRAAVLAMPHAEKLQLMKQLAVENRGQELAAITEAPAILTGITPELQTAFRDNITYQHARPEFDERKVLLEAILPALSIVQVANQAATDIAIGPGRLAEIERGEAAANAANAAFNASTSL